MTCRMLHPALVSLALFLGSIAPCSEVAAADGVVLSPTSRHLLSQLQAMSHGSHPAAEWNAVIESIEDAIAAAKQAGDFEEAISISLILADVYSEMLGNHPRGLKVLTDLRTEMAGQDPAGMPRVYAGLAEVYARMGNEQAIRGLISEFKAGRHYDPRAHAIQGGEDPSTPVTITRPAAGGNDSLTVTMMERSAREARVAQGKVFPPFEMVDTTGRRVRLADYRGRPVLLDFYVRGWRPWEDRLPLLRDLYARKRAAGFDILGICLERRTEGLDDYLAQHDITWRQVAGDTTVPFRLGIGGGAVSFLLDGQGRIVGRDLTGGDLTASVNRLLQ